MTNNEMTMQVRASDDAVLRLVSLFVGWGTPYMMLSINYETLFLLALFAQVCVLMWRVGE